MPAKTERQRRFFGAELARARAGKETKTKLPVSELRKFASKSKSPPAGIQAFTSNPGAASATPTVPTGFSNLPSPTQVEKAPVPPNPKAGAPSGRPSAVQENDSRRNLGNEPQTLPGGSTGLGGSARDTRPAGVSRFGSRFGGSAKGG